MTNTEISQQVDQSFEMFMLAAKECGFITPQEIKANFEVISLVAGEMVKLSKERVLTKLSTNPGWVKFLARKYQQRVLNS